MSRHTLGKWKREGGKGLLIYSDSHPQSPIATVSGHDLFGRSDKEAEANAQLMTEAPELLEALEELVASLNGRVHSDRVVVAVHKGLTAIRNAKDFDL